MSRNKLNTPSVSHQSSNRLTRRNLYLILVLIVIIFIALIAHTILRPDRNAALKIIYTGDVQGQIGNVDGEYVGYEKIAALKKQFSDDGDHVLLLDAGNCLGDSTAGEIDDGQSILELMNTTGYDAMTPGPMDFVYGADVLSSLRSKASFPFLAANILKSDGSTAFETYKILTINSVRIGVIGVTAGLNQTQAAKSSLTIADPVETVQNVLAQMSGKADAVIVLAYTGNEDVTQALADIKGVNIVIESGCTEASSNTTDSGTLIVSAGPKGNTIGVASLDITKNDVSADNQFYTASDYSKLSSDSSTADAVASVNQTINNVSSEPAGSVSLPADAIDETVSDSSDETDSTETESSTDSEDESGSSTANTAVTIYHQSETGIGNLTADAMLSAASSDGAVVALIPDLSISGTLTNGIVRRGQIQALYADDLYLVACKMTGGDLRAALEKSFDNYPKAEGFLQVSGISYSFSPSTAIGSRLSDIMVDGHKLDDARTYIVAMTNLLADSLGYVSESTGRVAAYKTIASVVTDYISKNSDVSGLTDTSKESGTDAETEDTSGTAETTETIDSTRIRINE